jgi:DNA-binding transcriptional regulator of glucitol operon
VSACSVATRFGSQDERVQVIRQCLDQPTLMIARPDLRAKALQALSEIEGSR